MLVIASNTAIYASTATPMAARFVVNNEEVCVDAYTIEENNYFKLRDFAMAMKGTQKEFEVTWQSQLGAINLVSHKAYTVEDSKLKKGTNRPKEAVVSEAKVYKDEKDTGLTVYKIGGSNYFKLRDLGNLIDVNIIWDSNAKEVKVNVPLGNMNQSVLTGAPITIQKDALKLPVSDIENYPIVQSAYENILLYMMEHNLKSYDIPYNNVMCEEIESGSLQETIKVAYTQVFTQYIEQFGSLEGLEIRADGSASYGTQTLILEPISGYNLKSSKETFFEASTQVVEHLIKEGKLTTAMTQKEKAKVLYEWVISNIEKDEKALDISRTGYGALETRKAICQGYTAIYHTLCKLVGIEVTGVIGKAGGEEHSWTLAILDGEKTYIDITYGAAVSGKMKTYDYRYFMISEDILSYNHEWDKSVIYKLK
ncbi:transglutaminase domain-containing protein [Cellulosilyticum ruminicola]|uniref:transglutaminase domain-containing protein n=1 Tax=Cellulosilyticum ruminicola TaxID=425254 RepID=UPI0006D01505|nr:transglutaminase domain-containing protein [Cellulosilyticum ruminicola]